ncbi:hypothetical protein J2X36_002506 [Methylobacterium sp. BE186]|uniref:DUF6968 family protein n=1 Tax=Methylobacterium sp. BE186 TaxID=2817715 RepID=UPI0028670055|nr:hypothetical protein [Methylobacterium sp. BE186]MDR7037755.1 hypothetical protein [Methylobacterium sp. BE186]
MLIATRILRLLGPVSTEDVAVRLYQPELEDGGWICRYAIGWPDGTHHGFAGGVDAVQALNLALQRVGFALHRSPHHAEGRLVWEKPGDGYGFPVPPSARDLLVGADRVFE